MFRREHHPIPDPWGAGIIGICFVPMTQVARSLQSGALLAVLPHYQQETAGFYVVYPKHKQIPRSVAAFLNMTFARAAESAWL